MDVRFRPQQIELYHSMHTFDNDKKEVRCKTKDNYLNFDGSNNKWKRKKILASASGFRCFISFLFFQIYIMFFSEIKMKQTLIFSSSAPSIDRSIGPRLTVRQNLTTSLPPGVGDGDVIENFIQLNFNKICISQGSHHEEHHNEEGTDSRGRIS